MVDTYFTLEETEARGILVHFHYCSHIHENAGHTGYSSCVRLGIGWKTMEKDNKTNKQDRFFIIHSMMGAQQQLVDRMSCR